MAQNNDEIYTELIQKQRKDCKESKKLNLSELKRISKNLVKSIFSEDECSIWNGYITNKSSNSKPSYVNFYFRNKKIALHRLLYENYIGDINDNQYLKFTCNNKGICCNVNHIIIVNSKKSICQPVEVNDESNVKKDSSDNLNMIVNFD